MAKKTVKNLCFDTMEILNGDRLVRLTRRMMGAGQLTYRLGLRGPVRDVFFIRPLSGQTVQTYVFEGAKSCIQLR